MNPFRRLCHTVTFALLIFVGAVFYALFNKGYHKAALIRRYGPNGPQGDD